MGNEVARPETARAADSETAAAARAGPRDAALSTLAVQLNASAPIQRLETMRPSGTTRALPATLRRGIETLSGVSMDGVRVHHNSGAPAQLQAHAFAQGRDIHLAPGQEQHLPHEAWHVAQQAQGRVRPTVQLKAGVAVNDDPRLEREADAMGARALVHAPVQMRALAPPPEDDDLAVVQGRFGVQIDVDELEIEYPVVSTSKKKKKQEPEIHKEIRIDRVDVAGRPPGLFSGAEKSHTTNWALYTDQLRNAILGRPPRDARDAIADLCHDAKNLPGVARVNALGQFAKNRYDTAEKTMNDLLAKDVHAIPAERLVDFLQMLARAYLGYRNVIPLSQVNIGRATGHGESTEMDYLRQVNDRKIGWREISRGGNEELGENARRETKHSIWKLMDSGAIHHMLDSEASSETAPGVRDVENGSARVIDAIVQHLHSAMIGYRDATDESFVSEKDSITNYLNEIGVKSTLIKKIASGVESAMLHGHEIKTKDNPERFHTKGPGGQGAFSVQLDLNDTGHIANLHIGGRPLTVLGTSQGSHTTAWLVYIDVVRNAVMSKTVAAAITAMDVLSTALFQLPGAKRVDTLTDHQLPYYNYAKEMLDNVLEEARAKGSVYEATPKLQRLIKAYLEMRNALPMSQIKGGLASGKAEARSRAILRYREAGFKNWTGKGEPPRQAKSIYHDAFWSLIDRGALKSMISGGITKHDAPGFKRTPEEKKNVGTEHEKPKDVIYIATTVKQHLITMRAAYPVVYNWLEAGGVDARRDFFNKLGLHTRYWNDFRSYAKPG